MIYTVDSVLCHFSVLVCFLLFERHIFWIVKLRFLCNERPGAPPHATSKNRTNALILHLLFNLHGACLNLQTPLSVTTFLGHLHFICYKLLSSLLSGLKGPPVSLNQQFYQCNTFFLRGHYQCNTNCMPQKLYH